MFFKKSDSVIEVFEIVQLCGDIPRIELFAREQKSGWDVWGNEVDGSVNLETSAYH